jgi:hypothetical protein
VSDLLARSARDADHRDLYRRLGATSAMCVRSWPPDVYAAP